VRESVGLRNHKLDRSSTFEASTRPSRETSCKASLVGPLYTTRSRPGECHGQQIASRAAFSCGEPDLVPAWRPREPTGRFVITCKCFLLSPTIDYADGATVVARNIMLDKRNLIAG
jgi:hypothetical protein